MLDFPFLFARRCIHSCTHGGDDRDFLVHTVACASLLTCYVCCYSLLTADYKTCYSRLLQRKKGSTNFAALFRARTASSWMLDVLDAIRCESSFVALLYMMTMSRTIELLIIMCDSQPQSCNAHMSPSFYPSRSSHAPDIAAYNSIHFVPFAAQLFSATPRPPSSARSATPFCASRLEERLV